MFFTILCSATSRYKRSRKDRSDKSLETLSGLSVNPLWWTSVIHKRICPRGKWLHSPYQQSTNPSWISNKWFVFLKYLLNWRDPRENSTRRRFSPSKCFQLLYLARGRGQRRDLISTRHVLWHAQLPAEVWVETVAQLCVDQMRTNTAISWPISNLANIQRLKLLCPVFSPFSYTRPN